MNLPSPQGWADQVKLRAVGVPLRANRFAGYAGPPDRKAAEVLSKYLIIDMYAKAAQGMPAEEAVKWAHEEVKKIHS